jgi:hypothetical protein
MFGWAKEPIHFSIPFISFFNSPDVENMLHCPLKKEKRYGLAFPKGVRGEKHGLPPARHIKPAFLRP